MAETLRVSEIYISKEKGAPMDKLTEVEAIAGVGLKGDRYAEDTGFWQTIPNPREAIREISIISRETAEAKGFSAEMTRRNIIIEGAPVNFEDWIGKEFTIAGIRMRGAELCTPCNRPSKLSGIKGF